MHIFLRICADCHGAGCALVSLTTRPKDLTGHEKEKAYAVAEGEIQALKRKIALLEDELERYKQHEN